MTSPLSKTAVQLVTRNGATLVLREASYDRTAREWVGRADGNRVTVPVRECRTQRLLEDERGRRIPAPSAATRARRGEGR